MHDARNAGLIKFIVFDVQSETKFIFEDASLQLLLPKNNWRGHCLHGKTTLLWKNYIFLKKMFHQVYAVLGSFSGIGGASTNAVIAYDRFKTISSPLDGKLTKGQAITFIILTWVWTMPFTSEWSRCINLLLHTYIST